MQYDWLVSYQCNIKLFLHNPHAEQSEIIFNRICFIKFTQVIRYVQSPAVSADELYSLHLATQAAGYDDYEEE